MIERAWVTKHLINVKITVKRALEARLLMSLQTLFSTTTAKKALAKFLVSISICRWEWYINAGDRRHRGLGPRRDKVKRQRHKDIRTKPSKGQSEETAAQRERMSE